MNIKEQLAQIISQEIEDMSLEDVLLTIEIPKKVEMGDYAFPCFRLSKVYRKAPNIIASELAVTLKENAFFEDVQVVGPYLNFFISKKAMAKTIVDNFNKEEVYGKSNIGEGKAITLDYSSPNIAKQFHIGHLRTTVIGNSIHRIHEYLGYKTVRINHLGDWGTQFGKMILAYKLWGSKEEVEKQGIQGLMNLYIKFHDEAEKNDTLNDEARAWFTKMEQGDEEALALWTWFKEISMIEFNRIYDLLEVEFDSFAGESFYNDKMQPIIEELKEKGLLIESDGANIVDLEDAGMPPCLITKKDGSSLYSTRDITAAIYRKNTYDFEKCIYVTALDQNLHFSQWFKVIEKMGYDWHNQLVHVPYGLVSLETGKLSTRKGNVLLLEDLLNESIDKSKKIIEEKNPGLENIDQVAKDIGIGAIKFNDLFNNRIKDVIFSWDRVLNFDGETGPYVQYTHARACSLIEKSGLSEFPKDINYDVLVDETCIKLLKTVELFPQKVIEAANKLEPYIITRYVVSVAQAFNKFYHENPILVEDEEVKKARLALVYMAKHCIKEGLSLIGVNAPNKM